MSEQTIGLDGAASVGIESSNGAVGTASPVATTTEKKARGTTTSDPKLVACVRIAKAIDALSASDRAFVLSYIGDRYPSN